MVELLTNVELLNNFVIYESVVLRYEKAELALQTICVDVSQLLFVCPTYLLAAKCWTGAPCRNGASHVKSWD